MSTRHVILGLLREQPGHTYDVAVRFGRRLEPWMVNRGQVYRTMNTLENEGLIEADGDGDATARSGASWRLTNSGSAELDRWFAVRTEDVEPLRSELLAKLAVAELADAPNLLAAIDWYEHELTMQIQSDIQARRAGRAEDEWTRDVEACIADSALLHRDAELHWIKRVRQMVEGWVARGVERPLESLPNRSATG